MVEFWNNYFEVLSESFFEGRYSEMLSEAPESFLGVTFTQALEKGLG